MLPAEAALLNKALAVSQDRKSHVVVPTLIRPLVPIKQWLESEYYLGPDYVRVYDFWKQEIADIFEYPNKYNEVIIDGALGSGKSTAAEIMLIRKIYELSCYDNIPAFFNQMSKSKIVFIYFSLSKSQAEATGFGEIRDLIDSSPYFQEQFKRCMDISSIMVWPQSRMLFTYGSQARHSIGMNLIGAILDEANFFAGGDDQASLSSSNDYSRVAKLYSSIINRAQSRFVSHGVNSSLSILLSSSTHSNSYTEHRKAESYTHSDVKYIHTRLWDVKPAGSYSKKNFWVFRGSDLVDPMIVETVEDINQYLQSVGLEKVGENLTPAQAVSQVPIEHRDVFIAIPEDFRGPFELNLISALQDIAGVSVSPQGRLFTSRPVYNKAVTKGEEAGLSHPFTKSSIVITHGDTLNLRDYLRRDFTFRNPKSPRFLHIDQSLSNDATGFASCYVEEIIEDNGVYKPVIAIDFMLQILPPKKPGKIAISKIRDFVVAMRDVFHLKIGKVTYDSFASAESIQTLEENHIACGILSVDRTDQQFLTLTSMLFENRLLLYRYMVFEHELFDLIHDRARRKVDHVMSSSKDVADGVAGAVWNAISADTIFSANKSSSDLAAIIAVSREDDSDRYAPLEDLSWV